MRASQSDPAGRQRVIKAYAQLNRQLAQVAQQEGVDFFDFNGAFQRELGQRVDADHFLVVGGDRIDLNRRGNEPHFGLLDDQYMHPGTVLAAVLANLYITRINEVYGTAIPPFSDAEILQIAGIGL
jgi:hypothetical protein